MGIYDRAYYRDEGGRPGRLSRWSVNTWLIAINIAVFVVQAFLPKYVAAHGMSGHQIQFSGDVLTHFGHFSTVEGFQRLEVWRLITFQFLHANLMHVLFNMFGLFIFGGLVEQYLGRKKYLAFYLVCGIAGGVSYLILNLLGQTSIPVLGALVNHPATPLVGASAGVFGVIVACAYIAPNTVVQLLFPPIPLKMKWFAYGYVGLAAFNLVTRGANAGGDAAHLGGAAAGYFFIRNAHLLRDFFDVFQNSNKPKRARRAGKGKPHWKQSGRGGPHKPSSDEVDRILQKVSTSGLHSLSEKEKKILRKASER